MPPIFEEQVGKGPTEHRAVHIDAKLGKRLPLPLLELAALILRQELCQTALPSRRDHRARLFPQFVVEIFHRFQFGSIRIGDLFQAGSGSADNVDQCLLQGLLHPLGGTAHMFKDVGRQFHGQR
jgi:hypothetical protein